MLHAKFQAHRPFGSGEEDFLRFLHAKFQAHRPFGYGEEDFFKVFTC